jgi:hypothetical protein
MVRPFSARCAEPGRSGSSAGEYRPSSDISATESLSFLLLLPSMGSPLILTLYLPAQIIKSWSAASVWCFVRSRLELEEAVV